MTASWGFKKERKQKEKGGGTKVNGTPLIGHERNVARVSQKRKARRLASNGCRRSRIAGGGRCRKKKAKKTDTTYKIRRVWPRY